MRLLNARTRKLESFEGNTVRRWIVGSDGSNVPHYAILSHTWGADEVSFQDIHQPDVSSKAGYQKIDLVCKHALSRGIEYVWVDTCCIDKSSSSELSEAINSMFRWYRNSEYCYAYLADVPEGTDVYSPESVFAKSRWFTRGWTLQELLAPVVLHFFSSNGSRLGSKADLEKQISDITGIGEDYLTGRSPISQCSIARRMSWVSRRNTTRTEDLAYCLLGIFGINMPLLYGEDKNAFVRLQEEIMKTSDDQSLFAWGYKKSYMTSSPHGPFADHPAAYQESFDFVPDEINRSNEGYSLTNKGLKIKIQLVSLARYNHKAVAVLACRPEKKCLWLVGIPILFHDEDSFSRSGANECLLVHREEVEETEARPLRFLTNFVLTVFTLPQKIWDREAGLIILSLPKNFNSAGNSLSIEKVEPPEAWDPEQRIIQLPVYDHRHVVLHLGEVVQGERFAILLRRVPPSYVHWETYVVRDLFNYTGFSRLLFRGQLRQNNEHIIKATVGRQLFFMAPDILVKPLNISVSWPKGTPVAPENSPDRP